MTENMKPGEPGAPAVKQKSSRISAVWVVPLVAAAVGGWLAFKHFRDAGVSIEVSFETASGIEPGKTKVRYKDIQVGLVDSARFSEDLSTVVLGITMERAGKQYLAEGTDFWVVQPRLGPGGVSGLGTIISGVYLDMRLGDGAATRKFVGLEEPPVAPEDVKGVRLTLVAEELGSLAAGVPIFFRDVNVGQVERTQLKADGSGVLVSALIVAPYDRFVRTTSHFWNASGVEVSLDDQGLAVRTEGLVSLLTGGLAFDSPGDGEPAKSGQVFQIYPGRTEATERSHPDKGPFFVFYPPGATGGLEAGAAVTLDGVVIGEVMEVKMEYSPEFGIRTPVQIRLEPRRIHGVSPDDAEEVTRMIADLVDRGLRAQLKTGSILTGRLYVELAFHEEVPIQLVGDHTLPELPAAPSTLQNLETKLGEFLDHLAAMPLDGLVEDAREIAAALRDLIKRVDGKVDPLVDSLDGVTAQVEQTLAAATSALASIDSGIAPDSTLYYNLATALEELSAAARSIRVLAGYLERNPNALIMGK